MFKIVVTFAVGSELAAWRRISRFERLHQPGTPIYVMRTQGAEVYAVLIGIGARSGRAGLQGLFRDSVDFCIASGLAGSLRRQYPAGAILVAKAVRTSGTDLEIQSDESLIESANKCGARIVDSFLTSNTVVNLPGAKSCLGEFADAVEMESFQIFSQARESGVPVVAVRAISDAVDTNVPIDFNGLIDDRGQISWGTAFCEVAKSPMRIPDLIRFGRVSSQAARNLAHFLDRYIKFLVAHGDSQFSVAPAETK